MNIRRIGLFFIVILVGAGLGAAIGRFTAPAATGPATAAGVAGKDATGITGEAPAGGAPGVRVRAGAGPSPSAGGAVVAAARPAAIGPIEAVETDRIIVRDSAGPVTVRIGPATRLTAIRPATRADLRPGERLMATLDGAGETPAATTILLGAADAPGAGSGGPGGSARTGAAGGAGGEGGGRAAGGTVASVEGDHLTLTLPSAETCTIQLTEATRIQKAGTATIDALTVGAQATVTGDRSSDGTVDARLIRLTDS